jgi:hypothetical protein
MFRKLLLVIFRIAVKHVKVKAKQAHYRPEVPQRFPGS